VFGVAGYAACGGERPDKIEAPSTVVVEVLLGEIEIFEVEFNDRLGFGRAGAGVPDRNGDSVGVLVQLEDDLLAGCLVGRVGHEFSDDKKRIVENVEIVPFAQARVRESPHHAYRRW
jgi:hypothetical protein